MKNKESIVNSSDSSEPTQGILGTTHTGGISEPVTIPTGNFNDAIDVSVTKVMHPRDLDSNIKTNQNVYSELDLKGFLARPYSILSSTFSNTDSNTTFSSMGTLASLNTIPYFSNKVSGFMSIRATTVFRLVVNGNPFAQGRYIMAWVPTGGTPNSENHDAWHKMHRYDLCQISQLPHVEIDISRETECILKIPYVSCLSAFPLLLGNQNAGSPGDVIIVPYSKFEGSSGPLYAPFDVFVSYEDVEFGPPMVPQSDMRGLRGGKRVVRGAAESEQESQSIGPLSAGLRDLAIAGRQFARIPMLSSVAETASWAADLASGVASAFGLSNPAILAPAVRVVGRIQPFATNADAGDTSMPLSLYSRNAVEVLPGLAATDMDEAAIDYVKKIFAYYTKFDWATTDSAGAVLQQIPCDVSKYFNSYSANGTSILTMAPITFLASLFKQYRGGLLFRFKVVCTTFHTGRLMVSLNPTYSGMPSSTPSVANTAYVFREVVDLRNGTEFCIAVPFIALQPYLPTTGSGYTTFANLQVQVMNSLVCPSTVPTTIRVIVEVAGAPDLEYAVPGFTALQPIVPYGLQSNLDFNDDLLDDIFSEQSVDFPANVKCLFDHVIGGAEIREDSDMAARICVGEKVTSLLALAKRSTIIQFPGTPGVYNQFTIDPFAWATAIGTTATTKINAREYVDYVGLFSSVFALQRGGVRIRTSPHTTSNTGATIVKTQLIAQNLDSAPYTGVTYNNVTYATYRFAPESKDLLSHTGGAEVFCAQYTPYHARASAGEMYATSTAGHPQVFYGYAGVSNQNLVILNDGTSGPMVDIFRAAADDFQLSMFTCIPTLVNADYARGITP